MDTVVAEQVELLRDQMVYITEPASDLDAGPHGVRFGGRRGPVHHGRPGHQEFPM